MNWRGQVFLFATALACLFFVEGDFCGFSLVSGAQSTGFYLEQSTLLRCILFTAGTKCHLLNRNVFDRLHWPTYSFLWHLLVLVQYDLQCGGSSAYGFHFKFLSYSRLFVPSTVVARRRYTNRNKLLLRKILEGSNIHTLDPSHHQDEDNHSCKCCYYAVTWLQPQSSLQHHQEYHRSRLKCLSEIPAVKGKCSHRRS
jgi:hypothetical protein